MGGNLYRTRDGGRGLRDEVTATAVVVPSCLSPRASPSLPLPSCAVPPQHTHMDSTAHDAPPDPATPAPPVAPAPSPATPALSAPLLRPPALQRGDTIGVAALSYAPRPGLLARGVQALERAGYGVVLDKEITRARRFQRHEDVWRAENFMAMWLDPQVKAVVGGTGGYGAVR